MNTSVDSIYSSTRPLKNTSKATDNAAPLETTRPRMGNARLGICCQSPEFRALLRRAAHEASIDSASLDVSDAVQWLEANPSGLLLLQATTPVAQQVQLDIARHTPELSHQVVFLQSSEMQNASPIVLPRAVTRPLPVNAKEASTLIGDLFSHAPAHEADTAKLIATAKRVAGSHPADHHLLSTDDEAYDLGRQLARFPVDLLLVGETGTGKDSLAKFIFQHADTAGNFVPINCAAIPEQLAEAELFGFEAGSFTGATNAKPGKFEDAHRGVLYLDEVDSCPLWLQAKLLRVLQDKGSERLGSSKFRPSDFRLIASTKADLPTLVAKGKFREDLYFRLNVMEIQLAPLRSRPERLQALFQHFVVEACQRFGLAVKTIDADTHHWLLQNPWLGNIRELKSAATRFVLPFPRESKTSDFEKTSLREALDACERGLILRTLARTSGNVSQAAIDLCVPMNTLYYRMKRLQINQKSAGSQPVS